MRGTVRDLVEGTLYPNPVARQTFAIGKEFDYVTPDELRGATAHVIRSVVGSLRQPPTIERVSYPFSSDAGGLVGPGSAGLAEVEVWRVPQGMRADINRITLELGAFPGAAATAVGRLALKANDSAGPMVYFWPQPGGNVAPSIESYGGDAPRLNGGERLVLVGAALAASTEFILDLQVTLYEDPARMVGESR